MAYQDPFDPDAYLARIRQDTDTGFDPDAYLASIRRESAPLTPLPEVERLLDTTIEPPAIPEFEPLPTREPVTPPPVIERAPGGIADMLVGGTEPVEGFGEPPLPSRFTLPSVYPGAAPPVAPKLEPGTVGPTGTALGMLATQFIPGRERRERAEELVFERAEPGIVAEYADLVALEAALGTAGREAGYMAALGPVIRPVGAAFARLAAAEKAAFPKIAQWLGEQAFRTTPRAKAAAAVSGAARGGVEATTFGVGRELVEEGPEGLRHLPLYAGAGVALGGLVGALTGLRISPSRAIADPGEAGRLAQIRRDVLRQSQRGKVTPEQELTFAGEALGVDPLTVTEAELGAALRTKAGRFHPEGATPDPDLVKVYTEAHAILKRNLRGAPEPSIPEPPVTAKGPSPVPEPSPIVERPTATTRGVVPEPTARFLTPEETRARVSGPRDPLTGEVTMDPLDTPTFQRRQAVIPEPAAPRPTEAVEETPTEVEVGTHHGGLGRLQELHREMRRVEKESEDASDVEFDEREVEFEERLDAVQDKIDRFRTEYEAQYGGEALIGLDDAFDQWVSIEEGLSTPAVEVAEAPVTPPEVVPTPEPVEAPERAVEPAVSPAGPARVTEPIPHGASKPVVSEWVKVKDLTYAPEVMQFRDVAGTAGARKLTPDPWDYQKAGAIHVWTNPADGLTYIVDGHHRYTRAVRDNVEDIEVKFIEADTAEEARAVGAMLNIADNNGTPLDVAKFIRDTGIETTDDLMTRGIDVAGDLASKGWALSRLTPDIFSEVVAGKVKEGWGVAIGQATEDPVLQRKALSEIAKQRNRSAAEAREMARMVVAVGTAAPEATTQESLFGEEVEAESLYDELSKVVVSLKKIIGADKSLYGPLLKGSRAERIMAGGVGEIDIEKAAGKAEASAIAAELFDRLYTRSSRITSLLTQAATEVRNGVTPATAAQGIAADVGAELAREQESVGRGGEGAPGPAERPAVEGAVPVAREGAPGEVGTDLFGGETPVAEPASVDVLGGLEGLPDDQLKKRRKAANRLIKTETNPSRRERFVRERDAINALLKQRRTAPTEPVIEPSAPLVTSLKDARTGRPISARLLRGTGKMTSPYNELGAQVPILGQARYTTPSREYAEYFGSNVTEVDVRLENPLVIRTDAEWRELTNQAGWAFPNPFGQDPAKTEADIQALRGMLEADGYDGVIVDPSPRGDEARTLTKVFGDAQAIEFNPPVAPAAEEAQLSPLGEEQRAAPEEGAFEKPLSAEDVARLKREGTEPEGARPLELFGSPTQRAVAEVEGQVPIGFGLQGRLEAPPDWSPGQSINRQQVMNELSKITEAAGGIVPILTGRMDQRGMAGQFAVHPEVIRTREAHDIATAAHEIGHATEKLVFGWDKGGAWKQPIASKGMQRELTSMGKQLYGKRKPAGGYKREGFAEFWRMWIEEDPTLERKAPKFYKWFEGQFLRRNPEIAAAAINAQDAARTWRTQGSMQRGFESMVDPAAPVERIAAAVKGIKRFASKENLFEMAQPMYDLAKEAKRRLGRPLKPSEDPYFTMSALRTTHAARAKRMVQNGMIDLRGNVVGPALADIRSLVVGKQKDFTLYMWARRALALWDDPQGPRNPGLSREDAAQIIAELEADPTRAKNFQLAASKVYAWEDGLLGYAAEASPVFGEIVERVRERDPGDYVPLQRMFEDLDDLWARTASRASTSKSPVKRMTGSGRRIKSIFPQIIAQAEQTIRASHERMILDQIINLSRVEGMGDIIHEVPVTQLPAAQAKINDILDQINKKVREADPEAEELGADIDPEILGETLTFFAPAERPGGVDPVVPIYDKGKVRWFRVDGGLYDALASLDVYRLPDVKGIPLLEMGLGKPAAAFRAGTTGLRASFGLIWNPLRDVQTMYVNSQASAVGPKLLSYWMSGMVDAGLNRATGGAVEGSEVLNAFLNLGGEMAQPLGQDIPHTRLAARQMFQGRKVRAIDPRNWFEWYRNTVQFPELAPRIAEVRAVAKDIGWTPGEEMTLDQSLQLLLAGKQVTTDFTAAGELARTINRMVPFHNAAIQGPRANLRAARRNPQKFVMRGLQLTAATLALWWANKDKEWYKQLDPREKMLHWWFETDWPEPTLIKMPRAFEVGLVFSAFPEAFVDSWYRQDPEGVKDWVKVFTENTVPSLWPVVPHVAYEQARNKRTYFGTPIVPMAAEQKPATEQFNEYTSRVAIDLARILGDEKGGGLSPMRIDHAIQGMFGYVAGDILRLVGLGPAEQEREGEAADIPVVGRLFRRGGKMGTRPRDTQRVYDLLAEAQKKQHSDRNPETEVERQQRLMLADAAKAITVLSYIRANTPGASERQAETLTALEIAKDVLARIESGETDRSGLAAQRRLQEARQDAIRGVSPTGPATRTRTRPTRRTRSRR